MLKEYFQIIRKALSENKVIVEAGSALQLSIQTGISSATISFRLRKYPDIMKKGYKIYYKK